MGNSSSTCSGEQIGTDALGNDICDVRADSINDMISNGTLHVSQNQGDVLFGQIGDTTYYIAGKEVNTQKLIDIINYSRPNVLNAIVASSTLSHDAASAKLQGFMDALVSKGIDAAVSSLGSDISPSGAIALKLSLDPVVKSIKAQESKLDGTVSDWAYSGQVMQGGCDCSGGRDGKKWMGGDDLILAEMKDYADSNNSYSKSNIISGLVKAFELMNINISGNNDKERLQSVLNQLPDANSIKKSPKAQGDLVKTIAKAINSAYKMDVINLNLSPELICTQIAEILLSLSSGMHSEFLTVYRNVSATLSNLLVLEQSLEVITSAFKSDMLKKGDTLYMDFSEKFLDAYNLLYPEIRRQITVLTNLVDSVLSPTDKQLSLLLNNKDTAKNLVDVLGSAKKLGTSSFSKVIMDVLRGAGGVGLQSSLIEKALKEVGLSVSEYMKANNVESLQDKLSTILMDKNMSPEDSAKFLKAVELLSKNFSRREDILAQHSSMTRSGGLDLVSPKSSIQERIENKKKVENLVFNAFNKKVLDLYKNIILGAVAIADRIGKEIPMTETLKELRDSLERVNLDVLGNSNMHQSLTGYTSDAGSMARKDSVVNDLKMLINVLNKLTAMDAYKNSAMYFNHLLGNAKEMLQVVDQYSDKVSNVVGSAEGDDFNKEVDCPHIDVDDDMVVGGDDDDLIKPNNNVLQTSRSITDALNKFETKFRAEVIKANISRSLKDREGDVNYTSITSQAIASYLLDQQKMFERAKESIKLYVGENAGKDAVITADLASASKFLDAQWESKKKLWATVEGLDQYLRAFTDVAIKNLDEFSNLKNMFSGIETLSSWYDDATGSALASVFDHFPSGVDTNGKPVMPSKTYIDVSSDHYYKKIEMASVSEKLPGDPYLMIGAKAGEAAKDKLANALNGLGILKNFFAVFASFASNISGSEMRSKSFIGPTQMYKNVLQYLQVSAFAQGFGDKTSYVADPMIKDDNKQFNNKFSTSISGRTNAKSVFTYNSATNTTTETKITADIGVDRSIPFGSVIDTSKPGDLAQKVTHQFGVWMRSICEKLKEQEPISFEKEDEYFVKLIKAMSSKILTVIGIHMTLEYPLEYKSSNLIRMIIGGGSDYPVVHKDSVELYLRLPLLAQFYKNVFGFNAPEVPSTMNDTWTDYAGIQGYNGISLKISMLPDFDGVYGKFITFMFTKLKYNTDNNYNDEDVKELIKIVNEIYTRMQVKYPNNTVQETINDFVNEVNRRYGIISKTDRDAYLTLNDDRYKRDLPSDKLRTDIPILPDELDGDQGQLSGAEKLLAGSTSTKKNLETRWNLTNDYDAIVTNFRAAIDKVFESQTSTASFTPAIKMAQRKLEDSKLSDEDRFKVVSSLLRGSDISSAVDSLKYMLFHETVVAGLNTLSGIHTLLLRFKQNILYTNIAELERLITEWITNGTPKILNKVTLFTFIASKFKDYNLGVTEDTINKFFLNHVFGDTCENATYIAKENGIEGSVLRFVPNDEHKVSNDEITANNAGGNMPITLSHLLVGNKCVDLKTSTKLQLYLKLVIDRKWVMKNLIESLFGISANNLNLVNLKIDSDNIDLDFLQLKNTISNLFGSISYFAQMLRPIINKKLYNRYIGGDGDSRPGSYYWLQEELMNKLIQGRSKDANKFEYYTLDKLVYVVNNTWKELTKEWKVSESGVNEFAQTQLGAYAKNHQVSPKLTVSIVSYASVFEELIFIDTNRDLHNSGSGTNKLTIADFRGLDNPIEQLYFNVQGNNKLLDTRYLARFDALYEWKNTIDRNRSIVCSFNQLIARYLNTFYDNLSSKIYINTIAQFTTSAFNNAINNLEMTYPDTAPCVYVKSTNNGGSSAKTSQEFSLRTKVNEAGYEDMVGPLATLIKYIVRPNLDSTTNPTIDQNTIIFKNLPGSSKEIFARAISYFLYEVKKKNISDINLGAAAAPADKIKNFFTTNKVAAQDFKSISEILKWLNDDKKYTNLLSLFDIPSGAPAPGVPPAAGPNSVPNFVMTRDSPEGVVYYSPKGDLLELIKTLVANVGDANSVYALEILKAITMLSSTSEFINAQHLVSESLGFFGLARLASNLMAQYTSNLYGTSELDFTTRSQLLATVIINLFTTVNSDAATRNVIISEITKALQTVPQIFVPSNEVVEVNIKYEDSIFVADKTFDSDYEVLNPLYGNIRLVRDDVDPGFVAAKPWRLLGSRNPSTGAVISLNDIKQFKNRVDPDANHLLFTSLAVIMRNIMSSKNSSQTPVYTIDNISDLPQYMKEKIRGNMPYFAILFKELASKCEIYKRLINKSKIDMTRFNKPTKTPWPFTLPAVGDKSANTVSRFTDILDGIIKGCNSLVVCCDQCIREIGDDPKYFELGHNFIKDYKLQNNKDPLMPLSSLTYVLRNKFSESYFDLQPVHQSGDDRFKFLYGARSILGSQAAQIATTQNLAGWNGIVDTYNMTSQNSSQVDKPKSDAYFDSFTKLIRYLYLIRHVKTTISPFYTRVNQVHNSSMLLVGTEGSFIHHNIVLDEFEATSSNIMRIASGVASEKDFYNAGLNDSLTVRDVSLSVKGTTDQLTSTFNINNNITETVKITESSYKDEKIKQLAEFLFERKQSQASMSVQNIIDLQIIPIQIYRLEKEVPLIHLHTYAYAFDEHIVSTFYNANSALSKTVMRNLKNNTTPITSSIDMLLKLLMEPYWNIKDEDYHNNDSFNNTDAYDKFVKKMLLGATGNKLGRPKFLSDQIYGKVLYGEVYPNNVYKEQGPQSVSFKQIPKDIIGTFIFRCLKHICDGYTPEIKLPNIAYDLIMDMIGDPKLDVTTNSKYTGKFNTEQSDLFTAVIRDLLLFIKGNKNATFMKNYVDMVTTALSSSHGAYDPTITPHDEYININKLVVNNVSPLLQLTKNNNGGITITTVKDYLKRFKSSGSYTNTLSYLSTKDRTPEPSDDDNRLYDADQVKIVDVTTISKQLYYTGRAKFDTVLVRNLIFITNMFRAISYRLENDIKSDDGPVTKSWSVLNKENTEFYGNESNPNRTSRNLRRDIDNDY